MRMYIYGVYVIYVGDTSLFEWSARRENQQIRPPPDLAYQMSLGWSASLACKKRDYNAECHQLMKVCVTYLNVALEQVTWGGFRHFD